MDITDKVIQLHLPAGHFVVVGSGPLMALGLIADGRDIDLAVSAEVYQSLKKQGWDEHTGHGGKSVLRRDVYDVGIGYGEWDMAELNADAFMVNGIPFISLQKVLAWKKAANRAKDARHIELIERYLAAHA